MVDDWKSWASVVGVALALFIAISGSWSSKADIGDVEKKLVPVERRVEVLEAKQSTLIREISQLEGSINVIKVQLASVEVSQIRVESSLREAALEVKKLMRELENKIERYLFETQKHPSPGWGGDDFQDLVKENVMSRTIVGLVAVLIGLLMQWIGVPVADEETAQMAERVVEAVGLLISLGGVGYSWWVRTQRGDLTMLGVRKGPEEELKAVEKLVVVAEQKVEAQKLGEGR